MVLRDEIGDFIMGCTLIFEGYVEVKVGEAMGFFEVLSWAKSMNLEKVVIEGDAKVVVDALNSRALNHTIFGDYVGSCR
ncbi:hypothetical protein ACS0TY_024713 [Phlomoides rotata]